MKQDQRAWQLMRHWQHHSPKCNGTMELGGHAPVLIFNDADIESAVDILVTTKFRNAGQVCSSPTRFLLQEAVADRFIDRFVNATQSLRIGNGLEPGVQMGPLANERRAPALEALVDDALEHGAELVIGGRRLDKPGNFFPPTVLKLGRLRLRGRTGARDEFLLAATAQNLRRMAKWLIPKTPQADLAPA